jgi:hypothetical protein
MSDVLHIAAQKIVDDPIFLKIVEAKLKSIMMDGKIDKKDIPDIVIMVIYCTNNLKKFNLSYNQLGEVLEETIIYLLNHFDVIPEENKEEFIMMTRNIVELVMMQPKVKTFFTSCFSSIWNCIRCNSKEK